MRWRGFGAMELLEPHGEGCSRGRGRKWWSLTEARWSAVERDGARWSVTERRRGSATAAQSFDVCAVAARLWIVGGGERAPMTAPQRATAVEPRVGAGLTCFASARP
jgi:hypothetical protein